MESEKKEHPRLKMIVLMLVGLATVAVLFSAGYFFQQTQHWKAELLTRPLGFESTPIRHNGIGFITTMNGRTIHHKILTDDGETLFATIDLDTVAKEITISLDPLSKIAYQLSEKKAFEKSQVAVVNVENEKGK